MCDLCSAAADLSWPQVLLVTFHPQLPSQPSCQLSLVNVSSLFPFSPSFLPSQLSKQNQMSSPFFVIAAENALNLSISLSFLAQ